MAEISGLTLPPPVQNLHAPGDPPVFILLASPAWGPSSWLPDTALQKIPIGVTGQVLTVQSDGSINWQNSAAGFANPMTTLGDLIEGGASGLATRLAIGSTGQVLTVSGGVPVWASPVTGFANPMTTTGDLIFSNPGSTPVRLGIGSSGQVLVVSGGLPSWSSSVLVNPMTTLGDIITGSTGGAAIRLPAGVANQVLTMVSGAPAWANSPAGFANPMTTLGDIITGATGGAAARLGVGAAGQVLTIVSGAPAWATNPAGFANPMTTPQDLIVGGVSGAAGRLGVGANNQVLTVVGGGVAWAPPPGIQGTPIGGPTPSQQVMFQQADGSILVIPLSTYGIVGGDDGLWINNAFGLLPVAHDALTGTNYSVGLVRLIATTYNIISGVVKPPKCDLRGLGPGTVLAGNGTITVLFSHHPATSGTVNNLTYSGGTYQLVVDGAACTGAAIGVDIGDGNGHTLEDIRIQNFDTSGGVGLMISIRHFWTEKAVGRNVELWNNETACLMTDFTGTNTSLEYNDFQFYIRVYGQGNGPNTGGDQTGIKLVGVGYNGSMQVRGNMISPFNSLAGTIIPATLSFFSNTIGSLLPSQLQGIIDIHTEVNGGGLAPYKIYFGDAVSSFGNVATSLNPSGAIGLLRFSGGTDPAVPTLGQFAFKGTINNCDPLRQPQTPTFPGYGTNYTNNQCDSTVYLSGGTVTAVLVDGVTQGTSITGPFLVPWNRTIRVNGSGAVPTWTWTAAL